MWCQRCQQDVPAVASTGCGEVVCARCHHQFQNPSAANVADNGLDLSEMDRAPLSPVEMLSDWQTEQRFRALSRTLRSGGTTGAQAVALSNKAIYRFDTPQQSYVQPEQLARQSPPQVRESRVGMPNQRSGLGSQIVAWLVLLSGTFAFGCGAGLACCSLLYRIPVYWNLGIVTTLVGQGMLILGLVMVLTRLWRNSRYASGKLQEINWQLDQVQQTAQTIVGIKKSNAPAFYAELAQSANPQMLLANLRGQLDQLALRMSRES